MSAITVYPAELHHQVHIATDFDELDSWGADYELFLSKLGDHGLFYHRGWLRTIWKAYTTKPNSLFFISIWQQGELLALAPFQLMQKGAVQGWRRVLTFFGAHHPTLVNPWPDILVSREAVRRECVLNIVASLSCSPRQWDLLELHQWREDSPNLPLLRELWPEKDFTSGDNATAQISLSQGYDDYQASLSGNLRNQLRRYRRRLEKSVSARFHATDHLSPSRWRAVKKMHYQRQMRLNDNGHDRYSIFGSDRESDALHQALGWAQEHGYARHYWLDIDGIPAAFCLGLSFGQSYFFYFVGMDERAEPYSGGMLLLIHLIEAEAGQGTRCIDLMFGLNRNKQRFANRIYKTWQCSHQNKGILPSARNGWVRLAKRLSSRD